MIRTPLSKCLDGIVQGTQVLQRLHMAVLFLAVLFIFSSDSRGPAVGGRRPEPFRWYLPEGPQGDEP